MVWFKPWRNRADSNCGAWTTEGCSRGTIAAPNHEQRGHRSSQSQVRENLQILQERGRKIEETENKARTLLDEAATYASLSKQLKMRAKHRWG